ncbi:MAG TPA: BtpA/SgcQ family protein [Terrimicrobiaceae bacterium]
MAQTISISRGRRILLVVIHLHPLPGSPRWGGDFEAIVRSALDDARACQTGGADGIVIENFGDVPFAKGAVPPETVAGMAVVGAAVRNAVELPLGFNVLRNDGRSALALCASCGGDFIRVNVLSGVMVTDQGLIEGSAFEVTRFRRQLAPGTKILADVHVKHASPLGKLPIEIAARDTAERGLADALVISGTGTGETADPEDVRRVRSACPEIPILVGSGVTASNCAAYLDFADGVIVGTSVKRDGRVSNPIDSNRVSALRKAIE